MWEKVILNLLSNALKFTFDGEIAIKIRPTADGKAVEVAVRDTGTGIPAEELPHLFERFHRVEGARGRSIEGSGIGLALVQELVRLHGGTISAASEVGVGSTFTVRLPLGTDHLPADRVQAGRASAPAGMRAQAYVQEVTSWLGDDHGPAADAADGVGTAGPVRAAAARREPSRSAGRRQSRHAPLRRALAARRRLSGRDRGRRRGGAGRGARLEARPRPVRRHDAAPRRLRPSGGNARGRGDQGYAGHPALRPRRRGSQGGRAAGRCRRLPGQAVLRPRATGADRDQSSDGQHASGDGAASQG